ncbi:DNA replication/repair protein RecF [Rhodovulum sp. DZ06]|uniref:DNA replication/repair protein RecF n=1 Tax=Rhodovulum sp. DZ06 TaxID=3425126 RepID=UPI003D343D3E
MTRRAVLSLSLTLYRSHPKLRLETDGRPVAIHGPNGAGKTNVLEAISMLSPGRGLRRAAAEEIARRPEALGWKVAARLETPGDLHEVETSVDLSKGAARSVRIDGKTAPQTRLGALAPVVWLTPAMDRLWIEGAGERRRFLDRLALAFEPDHAEAALAYEKAMRERNRLFKDDIRDPAWFAALEGRMAEAGAAMALTRARTLARIARAQDGAATAFPAAELSLDGPLEQGFAAAFAPGAPGAPDLDPAPDPAEAAETLRRALRDGRPRDAAAGRALTGPHRTDLLAIYAEKGVEARIASTGEQKALLVSLVLSAARAMAAEAAAPPVILLDEVAAHLDENRRAALFDEVCALGAQAWMTGAEARLFEALGPRADALALGAAADRG